MEPKDQAVIVDGTVVNLTTFAKNPVIATADGLVTLGKFVVNDETRPLLEAILRGKVSVEAVDVPKRCHRGVGGEVIVDEAEIMEVRTVVEE